MSYLEELLPEFRKGAKIRATHWDKDFYIEMVNGEIVDCNGNDVGDLSFYKLLNNKWELYQEPIDWDHVIRSHCPCWLWNGYFNEKVMRLLRNIEMDLGLPFLDENNTYWKNCRPVRRDEVTFYEDRKDE